MINANEKRFFFQTFCYLVHHKYALMKACDDGSGVCGDTSRVSEYYQAVGRLIGLCAPYEYHPDIDHKNEVIKIMTNKSNKIYMIFKADDAVGDL